MRDRADSTPPPAATEQLWTPASVLRSLRNSGKTYPATGWVRSIDAADPAASTELIKTGHGPGRIVAGHGDVWVANCRSRTVTRLDGESLEPTATMRVRGVPISVAEGPAAVWVLSSNGWVWRVGTGTGTAEGVTRLGPRSTAIVADGDRVWALRHQGHLNRLDPASGAILAEARVPRGARHMAIRGDSLWVSCRGGRELRQLDAHSGEARGKLRMPRRVAVLAADSQGVLAGCVRRRSAGRGWLYRPDLGGTGPGLPTELPGRPRAIAPGPGFTWVACGRRGHRGGRIVRATVPGAAEPWVDTGFFVSDLLLAGDRLLATTSLKRIEWISDGSSLLGGFGDGWTDGGHGVGG